MAGNVIAMPQPLYGDDVEYSDGTIASEQEVNDLVTFLTWTLCQILKQKSSRFKSYIFSFYNDYSILFILKNLE